SHRIRPAMVVAPKPARPSYAKLRSLHTGAWADSGALALVAGSAKLRRHATIQRSRHGSPESTIGPAWRLFAMPDDAPMPSTDLHYLTITEAARLIEQRRLSPVE